MNCPLLFQTTACVVVKGILTALTPLIPVEVLAIISGATASFETFRVHCEKRRPTLKEQNNCSSIRSPATMKCLVRKGIKEEVKYGKVAKKTDYL